MLYLDELNVDIIEAQDGQDALRQIKLTPHLIVSNINMPKMNGFSLLKNIKENGKTKSIPGIVITSDYQMETRDEAFHMGSDDFVTKSFKPEDFVPRVKKFVI